MTILLLGILSFLVGLVVHILVWRIRPPEKSAVSLSVIFFLSVNLSIAITYGLAIGSEPATEMFRYLADLSFVQVIHCAFVGLSLSAGYIMSYPAVEVDSPSFLIVEVVDDAGEKGIARSKLEEVLGNQVLVYPRIVDMLNEDLAILKDGRIFLTGKGKGMNALFATWRRFLGAGKGG